MLNSSASLSSSLSWTLLRSTRRVQIVNSRAELLQMILEKMNLALVHDRLHIKSFWEKRIHDDTEHAQTEEQRRSRSALGKLRGEWLVRLEARNKHLKTLNENFLKKPKTESTDQNQT